MKSVLFLPILNKKDQHANFWIKRFNVLSFFECVQVMLNRKSIWHGLKLKVNFKLGDSSVGLFSTGAIVAQSKVR